MGDAGIYDLLLHSKNHMMALPEVFKLIRQAETALQQVR